MTEFYLQAIYELNQKKLLDYETAQYSNKETKKFVLRERQIENLVKSFASIAIENLYDVSDNRTYCLEAIKVLCQSCPIKSGEYLFTKNIVSQMMHLMV